MSLSRLEDGLEFSKHFQQQKNISNYYQKFQLKPKILVQNYDFILFVTILTVKYTIIENCPGKGPVH